MADINKIAPENTAARVALWRALHSQVDAAPHIIEDEIGLKLLAPDDSWRQRPDMDVQRTKLFRASIVARARFIEDLVAEQVEKRVRQYVILGAGLDTFAQRKTELAAKLNVFEVDQPGPQMWKQQRLAALGFSIPIWLHFVPVDFETDWWEKLMTSGFNRNEPAIVTSTGVSMYLTRDAVLAMMGHVASLASGTKFAMTFMQPFDTAPAEERPGLEAAAKGARANGTPFVSFFLPDQIKALAREAGFKNVEHIPFAEFNRRYFSDRQDGLRLSVGEEMIVAST